MVEAPIEFDFSTDVQSAGVLFALPSLLSNGLLKYSSEHFSKRKGYYGLKSIFLSLAFMALLRIKSLEKLRSWDPGEFGKLLGLDRVPEVKTLRSKIEELSEGGNPEQWSRDLGVEWMNQLPDHAGSLYVDGHTRVYSGKQTKLPKRYVSRQKLCLRGMSDYWVNDALGRPFFVVSQPMTQGLLHEMRETIVPRLLEDIPNQPSEETLKSDPHLPRFEMIFDREGYSPKYFKEMWAKRIASISYRKNKQEDWGRQEFFEEKVLHLNGESSVILLAERGVYFKKENFWMREIRKLSKSGHQTAILTTNYHSEAKEIAVRMFARWSQENFFKYMMEHYGIDALIDYRVEDVSDLEQKVVNPKHREITTKIRSENGKLSRMKIQYASLAIENNVEEKKVKKYVQDKLELREEIKGLEKTILDLKSKKNEIPKHISFGELPEESKFKVFKGKKKQFLDTLKMIAYRSETAMAMLLQPHLKKKDEARAVIRQIFLTDADLVPDHHNKVLNVRLHNMTTNKSHQYVKILCQVLNDSETHFPGTDLRLVYDLVSDKNPRVPDV